MKYFVSQLKINSILILLNISLLSSNTAISQSFEATTTNLNVLNYFIGKNNNTLIFNQESILQLISSYENNKLTNNVKYRQTIDSLQKYNVSKNIFKTYPEFFLLLLHYPSFAEEEKKDWVENIFPKMNSQHITDFEITLCKYYISHFPSIKNVDYPEFSIPNGHIGPISSVSFNDSKKYIATVALLDNSIIIWESSTLRIVKKINLAGFLGYKAKFTPDNSKLICISIFGEILLIDLQKYTQSYLNNNITLNKNEDDSTILEANPDIINTSNDEFLFIVKNNVFRGSIIKNTLELIHSFSDSSKTLSLAKSGTDNYIRVIENGTIEILNLSFKLVKSNDSLTQEKVISVFNVPDKEILILLTNRKLHLVKRLTLTLDFTLENNEIIRNAIIDPSGSKIICLSKQSIIVFDISTHKEVVRFIKDMPNQNLSHSDFSALNLVHGEGTEVCLTGKEGKLIIYDYKKNMISRDFWSDVLYRCNISISPDEESLICTDNGNNFSAWNIQQSELNKSYFSNIKDSKKITFTSDLIWSPDSKTLIAPSNNTIYFFEPSSSLPRDSINVENSFIKSLGFSKDTNSIWTYLQNGEIVYYNIENKKQSKKITTGLLDIKDAFQIKNTSSYVVLSENGELVKILISDKNVSKKVIRNNIVAFTINENDELAAVVLDDFTICIYDLKTGLVKIKLNEEIKFYQEGFSFLSFSKTKNALFFPSKQDNNVVICRFDILTKRLSYIPIDYLPVKIQFTSSSFFVIGSDNIVRAYSMSTNNLLYIFFETYFGESVTLTPLGYYKCSKFNAKRLYFSTSNWKIIPFSQLDLRFNRPDLVFRHTGTFDSTFIKPFYNAYAKRLTRMGFNLGKFQSSFTIPESDFINRELINLEQTSQTLRFQIKGKSAVYLDRFNIWINEVPLYGQKGISLRKKNSKTIDTTITVILSAGENQIETSVTDINGIESYRQPLYVKYNPEKPVKSNTYFIGIGINRFADNRNNLSWSVKDIRDLSQYFASKGAIIDTLFDERVTRTNILNLKQRLAGATEEDKVIIAYSGHGLLSSDFDYYLSTHTVNFSKPEENGLPYEELESLLDGIRARKKLMLIDACHSGEVDKEEIARYETAIDSLQIKGTRGGKPRVTSGNSLGMKNSFELMQELFVNVGRSTGATVISAAGGTQFAQERGDLKNGVFSFVLLELFRNSKTVSISDLKKTVLKRVPELTNGLQKPTFRSEIQRFDWSL